MASHMFCKVAVVCSVGCVGLGTSVFWVGCQSGETNGAPRTGNLARVVNFPVEVVSLAPRKLTYQVNASGSLEAFERVQITARVPGVLEKISFVEGDHVRAGQLIAQIEPARYRIAVQEAAAALQVAESALRESNEGLQRRENAARLQPGLVRGEELETWRSRVRTDTARKMAAQSAYDRASLDLRYALVKAPMDGIIENRPVQTGQYVRAETLLTNLVQRDPLRLRFSVTELESIRLRVGAPITFKVATSSVSGRGTINHVGQIADDRSRMVTVLATVRNSGEMSLLPGSFAEISIPVETNVAALVIPQKAVRPSDRGFLVFVIQQGKAAERVVELGLRTSNGDVEVTRGLAAGDDVVVQGAEALRNGVGVEVAKQERR